ncbi:MAG: polysaccharide biosynthesis/export family protein [Gemmatimonadales bacterium]
MRPARFLLASCALAALAVVGACGGGMATQALAPAGADSSALALRPGDIVKVQVFGHEELSGEFPVNENLNVTLPVVGEFSVQGMSIADLRARIRREIGQLYTQSLVTVTPKYRVAVLGEIMRPGLYSVDPTMTVYDVLAEAGGPTHDARESQIRLLRGGQEYHVALASQAVARATLRELGIRSGDQILVPRKPITLATASLLLSLANLALVIYVAQK